jgi:hypothetical protein
MDAMGGGNSNQDDTVRNGLQDNQTNGQHNQHKGQELALRAAARRSLHRSKRSETVEKLVGEVCDQRPRRNGSVACGMTGISTGRPSRSGWACRSASRPGFWLPWGYAGLPAPSALTVAHWPGAGRAHWVGLLQAADHHAGGVERDHPPTSDPAGSRATR